MNPDDPEGRPVEEHEQARLIACDALLRAAFTGQEAAAWSGPSAPERGHDRLRLLLKMLEESAGDANGESVAERFAEGAGVGHDGGRPILGRFEVLEHVGSGGFGFVVRARDRMLCREVALKMPLPERVLESGGVDRFLREARSAARLDHPNIVRVHDAGELGPLGYFIASEFCPGPSLRCWLKGRREAVPPRLAARLVADLADAIPHAHERGILHRDIKPDNIILAGGPEPDEFIPRLTDFGLAKLIEQAGDETRSEARLGTPHYMAPEQAAGRRREIGPATDVYALGATLYELLTGRPPFRGESDAETLRLVLETEPLSLRLIRPSLPRDLETICMKCLRKEPARRYRKAADLCDELRRFLDGRPILGRPVSSWERARAWAQRRPAVTVLLAMVVLLACGLVGGIAGWTSWIGRHNRQLRVQIARADRQTQEAENQRHIAEERRGLSARQDRAASLRRAQQALEVHESELAQDILHDLRPDPETEDTGSFARKYLWRQAHREFSQLWGHEAIVRTWVFSPDGRTLGTRDEQGKVLTWDLAPKMALDRPCILPIRSALGELSLSGDGRRIAICAPDQSTWAVNVFDSASGKLVARLDCGNAAPGGTPCFDPDRSRLTIKCMAPDGHCLVLSWDLAQGGPCARSWPFPPGTSFLEMPTTGRIVSARASCNRVLDAATGEDVVVLSGHGITDWAIFHRIFCWSADGRVFAAATQTNRVSLWDTRTGRELAACQLLENTCRIALSPKGMRLAILSGFGGLTVFDRSGERPRVLTADSERSVKFHSLSFSSDEGLLAVGQDTAPGGPQAPEVWDIGTGRRVAVFSGRNLGPDIAFVPGRRALLVMGGARPRFWRLDPPSEPDALSGHTAEAWAAAFSPDGKILATGSDDVGEHQTIKLWDPISGRLQAGWRAHTATVCALAFSPDGRMLASGSLDAGGPKNPSVMLWDVASHQRLTALQGHRGPVRSVAFSPDGRTLATGGDDRTARLWDVATRSTRAILTGHGKRLNTVAFSPDGKTLASASHDTTVRLWDIATGDARAVLSDAGNVHTVAFAPDGALLASGNEDGELKLWSVQTGELVRSMRGESDLLRSVKFSPDSRSVVAAGKRMIIRMWDVLSGQELLTLKEHKAQINALAFSPDGSILASCSHDGAVKLWRTEPIDPLAAR
jgi:WD40 repeat protein